MDELYRDESWLVEYYRAEGGLLSFDNLQTGESFIVGLRSLRTGLCIARGQFRDSLRKYGIDRTANTFKKIAACQD